MFRQHTVSLSEHRAPSKPSETVGSKCIIQTQRTTTSGGLQVTPHTYYIVREGLGVRLGLGLGPGGGRNERER